MDCGHYISSPQIVEEWKQSIHANITSGQIVVKYYKVLDRNNYSAVHSASIGNISAESGCNLSFFLTHFLPTNAYDITQC